MAETMMRHSFAPISSYALWTLFVHPTTSTFYPGEINVRMADLLLINKVIALVDLSSAGK
jgi:predicted GTPase